MCQRTVYVSFCNCTTKTWSQTKEFLVSTSNKYHSNDMYAEDCANTQTRINLIIENYFPYLLKAMIA